MQPIFRESYYRSHLLLWASSTMVPKKGVGERNGVGEYREELLKIPYTC